MTSEGITDGILFGALLCNLLGGELGKLDGEGTGALEKLLVGEEVFVGFVDGAKEGTLIW